MDEKYLYFLNNLVQNMFHEQKSIPYIMEKIKLEYIPKDFQLQRSVLYATGNLWKEERTINKITVDAKATPVFRGDNNELIMYMEFLETTKPELESEECVEYILEKWRLERLRTLSGKIQTVVGYDNPNYNALGEMASQIIEIAELVDNDYDPKIGDIIRSQPLVEFHNSDLRTVFNGVLRQNLTFLAAEPGMGKTSVLVAWTQDFLNSDKKVMWFTNDGTYTEFMQKFVSHRLRINSELLVESNFTEDNPHGRLSEQEYEDVRKEIEVIKNMYIDTGKLIVLDNVTTLAETKLWIRREKPDVAIIDTMQGMDMPNDEPMATAIPVIMRGLRNVSKQTNSAIIGATWMECGGARPRVNQIYASQDMRRRGAKIYMLYYFYSTKQVTAYKNMLELTEGKSRFKQQKGILLGFKPEYSEIYYPSGVDDAVIKQYKNITKY
jgi:replicative DNA helicase